MRASCFVVLVMSLLSWNATAQNVGKCVAADGSVTLTDKPCPRGSAMKQMYAAPESYAPPRDAGREVQRAQRIYDSIPEPRPPKPISGPAQRLSNSSDGYPDPDKGICLALKQQKESINNALRYGTHSAAKMDFYREQLRGIRESQCRQKCIRC